MTVHDDHRPDGNSSDTDAQMNQLLSALETPDHRSDFWARFDDGLDAATGVAADATVTIMAQRGAESEMTWIGPAPVSEGISPLRRWGLSALSAAAAIAVVVVGFAVFAGDSSPTDSTVVLSEPSALAEPTPEPVVVATEPTVVVQPTPAPEPTTEPTPVPAEPTPEATAPVVDPLASSPDLVQPTTGPFSCTAAVGTEDHLNVRSAPALSAPVLDEIAGGSCAIWVSEFSGDDGWASVRYGRNGDRSGWVSARFLTEVSDPNRAIVDVHGVAGITWGTPWLEGEEALVAQLGTPDSIGDWVPLCSQGGGESERLLRWSNLTVRFRGVEDPQLVAARIDGEGLYAAVNGLTTGLAFSDVRAFFPGAATAIDATAGTDGTEGQEQWVWRSEAAVRAYRPTFSGDFSDPDEPPTAESLIGDITIGQWAPGC